VAPPHRTLGALTETFAARQVPPIGAHQIYVRGENNKDSSRLS
jgi:hypothetical protein